MMRHREIPPSLHFQQPNPHIPFEELALRVVGLAAGRGRRPVARPSPGSARSVSAAPTRTWCCRRHPTDSPELDDPVPRAQRAHLLAVSARSDEALRELVARYDDSSRRAGTHAHAALSRRSRPRGAPYSPRAPARLRRRVRWPTSARRWARSPATRPAGPVLRLPGGSADDPRWPSSSPARGRGGGRSVSTCWTQPVFRGVLEHCDALLRDHVDWSLLEEFDRGHRGSRLADPASASRRCVPSRWPWRCCGGPGASSPRRSSGTVSARSRPRTSPGR